MHAALLAAAEESAEAASGLPPEVMGLLGFGTLVVLLVSTYAFRSVGNRHR